MFACSNEYVLPRGLFRRAGLRRGADFAMPILVATDLFATLFFEADVFSAGFFSAAFFAATFDFVAAAFFFFVVLLGDFLGMGEV